MGGLSHGAVFTELRNQEADVPGEDLVSPARFPFTVCRFSSLFRGLPLISSTWRNLEPVTRAGDSTQQAHSPCSLDNSWLYLRETPSCVCVCVHSLCSLDNSRLYLRETPSRVCVCVCVCVCVFIWLHQVLVVAYRLSSCGSWTPSRVCVCVFIWLHWVLVAAHRLSSCGSWTPSRVCVCVCVFIWLHRVLVGAHSLSSCGSWAPECSGS